MDEEQLFFYHYVVCFFSCVSFVTSLTVDRQAPLSMGILQVRVLE